MKKNFTIVLIAIFTVFSFAITQVNAQVAVGVKAGANMSNYLLDKMPNTESSMKVGAQVGGFVKYNFNPFLGLQADMMFHYKASEIKDKATGQKSDIEAWGMEVPIYAMASIPTYSGKIYLGVGPYVGFGFSAKNKTADVDLYDTKFIKRFDLGAAAILGYELKNGFQINANYQFGALNLRDKNKGDSKLRMQGVSLGLGYRF